MREKITADCFESLDKLGRGAVGIIFQLGACNSPVGGISESRHPL